DETEERPRGDVQVDAADGDLRAEALPHAAQGQGRCRSRDWGRDGRGHARLTMVDDATRRVGAPSSAPRRNVRLRLGAEGARRGAVAGDGGHHAAGPFRMISVTWATQSPRGGGSSTSHVAPASAYSCAGTPARRG